jgi:hypothetical protein
LHSLAGIAALNLLFLVVGVTVVWAVAGLPSWGAFARLAGVAYLLGVALGGIAWTLLLVGGVPLPAVGMWLALAAIAFGGVAGGALLRRPLPHRPRSLPTVSVLDVAGFAVVGLLIEELFRAGRLAGLYTFDAWAFWIPKAEAIAAYHGLDARFFSTLPGPTYPPLLPAVEAADLHAMGSWDTATLHLQFGFLAIGFVAALLGCLWDRAPHWLVWPCVVLALAAPRMTDSLLAPQADFLLDYLFAIAALLLVLWLVEGQSTWVILATPLLVAAVLTKREGLMLVACLLVAIAVARGVRRSWRPLAIVAAIVGAASLAWHAWYAAHGVGGEVAPGGGLAAGIDPGRAADALWLSLRVLLDPSRWSVLPWVGLVALAAAAAARRRALVVLVGVTAALAFLGGAWVTWSFRGLAMTSQESLNPIVRYTASIELLFAATVPLLAGAALGRRVLRPGRLLAPVTAGAIVAAVLLAFPLAGLAGGLPHFPSRSDCVRSPVAGQPVAIVFGRFDRLDAAQGLLARVESVGFKGVRIEQDGCGRLVLWLPDAPSVAVGQSVVDEARSAKLEAHLELGHR